MKRINMKIITSIFAILTILLTPCSAFANDNGALSEPTKGFIWEATNGDNSIYLVGTMHPAPKDINFFNNNINEIIKNTDGLATEVDLTDKENIKELQDYMLNNIYLNNGEIRDFLTGDEEKILYNILIDHKLTYDDVKKLNSNGLILALNNQGCTLNGFTGPMFDLLLQQKYKELNKEVVSLESIKEQMDAASCNMDSLKNYIDKYNRNSLEEEKKYENELFNGYKNGDHSVGESVIKMQQENKETYKKILVDRNVKMADKIEDLSKSDKKYMVAVGYLHYFGEDSLLKLLEKKGYTIKPIN
ncbi:TraB/GumN family protein [Clostridium beijerinckii]|uniref:TraB/GumN family protein n=1 Tax=Clostridium beijerinckii TaxID=1520 RepID=UPI000809CCB0|nr:TraB/GumN family protein [Clostridium beijerinckii]OCA97617.1 hypothetical protein BGS1_20420 [Clostridium beijerinckii]